MMTTKNYLIGTVVIAVSSYFFSWFDSVESVSNIAVVLAWCALYEILRSNELGNQNLDKIEKRLQEMENKL